MSNRRKTRTARDGAPVSVRREADGTLAVVWPKGRPSATVVSADAIEALVAAHNEAILAAPAPRRTLLARLGSWR